MSKILMINNRKVRRVEKIKTCFECDELVSELWACDTCGKLFCEDHIIQEGNGTDDIRFICTSCQNKRMGVS